MGDELQHVFVAGDDVGLQFFLRRRGATWCRSRRRLRSPGIQGWGGPGFAEAADEGDLDGEIVGHGRALSFVVGEKFVAEGGSGDVEDDAEVIGLPVLDEFADHVGEEVRDVGGRPAGPAHAHGHGGVEGAEDVAHSVDEEEAVWGR